MRFSSILFLISALVCLLSCSPLGGCWEDMPNTPEYTFYLAGPDGFNPLSGVAARDSVLLYGEQGDTIRFFGRKTIWRIVSDHPDTVVDLFYQYTFNYRYIDSDKDYYLKVKDDYMDTLRFNFSERFIGCEDTILSKRLMNIDINSKRIFSGMRYEMQP